VHLLQHPKIALGNQFPTKLLKKNNILPFGNYFRNFQAGKVHSVGFSQQRIDFCPLGLVVDYRTLVGFGNLELGSDVGVTQGGQHPYVDNFTRGADHLLADEHHCRVEHFHVPLLGELSSGVNVHISAEQRVPGNLEISETHKTIILVEITKLWSYVASL
jgi:hypothetical protein